MANPSKPALSNYYLAQHSAIEEQLKCLQNGFTQWQDSDTEQSIPARFKKQVQTNPQKVAVQTADNSYTYEELDQASNQIMRAILEKSADPRSPVAVFLKHDAPLIAAILGTLKAGRMYVPLDPSFPRERNDLILAQSNASTVLVDSRAQTGWSLPIKNRPAFIDIAELSSAGTGPAGDIEPDTFAYVIFTSGSTAVPKGVVQTHRNVLQVVRRYTNSLHIGHRDQVTLLSSCNVTASVANLFSALLNGASLFPFDIKEKGFSKLAEWLQEKEITVYHSVPAVFRQLLHETAPGTVFQKIRLVRMGGDVVYKTDLELFKKYFSGDAVLVNGYGCSEISSVWHFYMNAMTELSGNIAPVGYPIAEIEGHLEDESGKITAAVNAQAERSEPSETGEIVIRTAFVSPGYWDGLPRENFHGRSSRKLPLLTYRTGDLGYYLPGNCLVHAGRKDSQVKIRGFRVEMAEVEARLRSFPGVKEAAVTVSRGESGDQQLLAFVVFHAGVPESVQDVRAYLRMNLPTPMLPAQIFAVEALPLTPNGKIDRAAVGRLEAALRRDVREFKPPRTETELRIAGIWKRVLGLDNIGSDQSFFESGGNSILAIRAMAELRRFTGCDLPLRMLFDNDTVAQLASAVVSCTPGATLPEGLPGNSSKSENGTAPGPAPALRHDSVPSFPANTSYTACSSYAQRGLSILYELNPRSCAFNMERTVRLYGPLDERAWIKAFHSIVNCHDALRTSFARIDDDLAQVITSKISDLVTVIDLSMRPPGESMTECTHLLLQQLQEPFKLEEGPLVRATLARLSSEDHIFSVVMHHIISDRSSIDIVFRELNRLYTERLTTGKAPLPTAPFQYAHYCEWEKQNLEKESSEDRLRHWESALQDWPLELSLYTDYAAPSTPTFRGGRVYFSLSEDLASRMKAVALKEHVTVFMFLLAAFELLLFKFTDQEHFLIGSPVSGRTLAESDKVVGLFTNVLLLRADVSGDPSFTSLVKTVREICLDAFEYQDIPFDYIAEKLKLNKKWARPSLLQVTFTLQEHKTGQPCIPGIKEVPMVLERNSAKYDLMLLMGPEGDGLSGIWEYNSDLFSPVTIQRYADSFQALIKNITMNPQECVSLISAVPDADRQKLLSRQ